MSDPKEIEFNGKTYVTMFSDGSGGCCSKCAFCTAGNTCANVDAPCLPYDREDRRDDAYFVEKQKEE